MSQSGRTRLLAASAVAAVMVMLSSSAWACAVFKGQMVVQGNKGTGMVTSIGTSTSGMTWCPGYPIGKAKATLGGTVSVTVSKNPAGSCQPGLKLNAGTYQVNYSNGAAHMRSGPTDKNNADGSRAWVIDCANPMNPLNTALLGSITVDSLGQGSGTFTVPTSGVVSGPTDEAGVCVTDALGNDGNQAPVTIL